MKVKDIIKNTEWISNPSNLEGTPRFSIFLPTYCRCESGYLRRAIQSVLQQTYGEFELIIIDDGSVDGSFEEIQSFMTQDPRIHCLRHPRNVGLPAIGCYEAFLKSKGEYLMFCFDDTEYKKNALEQVERYVSEHRPNIAFGYIDFQYRDEERRIRQTYLGNDQISQAALVGTNFLPNLGVVLRRGLPAEIGFLDPHLAIARMTDWDWWKRAAKVYELHYSDIHIGTEFGLVTSNSIGLTYPLNQWLSYEWTERNRNSELIPERYEEYDVQYIPDDLSDQARLALQDISRFYENKFWYHPLESLTLPASGQKDGLDRNARILVITHAQDASVTLTFEFIPGAEKNIRYVSPQYISWQEMMSATVIIISRHLFSPEIQRWIEIARQLGIPHYYFLDDNFIILSKEIPELKNYTEDNIRKELTSFSGVLVASKELAAFFLDNHIHPNVYLFPQVLPSKIWLDHLEIPEKSPGVTRIGFMGGIHRNAHFTKFVLPAIFRLAEDHLVELVVAGNHKFTDQNSSRLKIYRFPFDTSYRLTLGRMKSADIDILVHSGSNTRNNPYKSRNVLLNAWALKAFPILSNQPPYGDVEDLGLGLLCDSENPVEWYENLVKVISDPSLVTQVHDNLHRYVVENFSGDQNFEVLKKILDKDPTPGVAILEDRFRNYLIMLERELHLQTIALMGNSLMAQRFIKLARKLKRFIQVSIGVIKYE